MLYVCSVQTVRRRLHGYLDQDSTGRLLRRLCCFQGQLARTDETIEITDYYYLY